MPLLPETSPGCNGRGLFTTKTKLSSELHYQVMPPLSDEDYQALKRDIDAAGVLIPVEYDEDGNILDGHHRVKICAELGITDWPKYIRKGLSEEGKFAHARQLNIARRHINKAQKRALIADQLKATPHLANNNIAAMLGVSHHTVQAVRAELESTWQIAKLKKTVGKDGKARRKPKRKHIPTQHIPEEADIGELFKTAKVFRAAIAAARRIKRLDNLAEIAKGNKALDTSIRYPIIYADPQSIPPRDPILRGSRRQFPFHDQGLRGAPSAVICSTASSLPSTGCAHRRFPNADVNSKT